MEVTITVNKTAQARINPGRCINCGECRKICPTGAIREYQKNVSGLFSAGKEEMLETSCSVGCPMGIIPQTVAAFMRDGEAEKAWQHIIERTPMPWTCAEVCRGICYGHCRLLNIGADPIDMHALEKAAVRDRKLDEIVFTPPTYDRVAIIGGGPAGIMAAFELRRAGYRPVIFEKRDRLGGAMSWGISDLRLDKEKLHQEIDRLIRAGIEVRYNYALGQNFSMSQLWEEGFAACLLATGMSDPAESNLRGADCRGVFEAIDILKECNDGGLSQREKDAAGPGIESMGQKIAVVGRGWLLADTAAVLASRGKDVICIAVEGQEEAEMSLEDLQEMGVECRKATEVRQVISDASGVKAIEVLDGARASNLFCEGVVLAFGQRGSVERISKVETYPDGCIRIDGQHRTNKEKIYACGEITGKSRSVVEAMAQGRAAALAMDADLRKTGEGPKAPSFDAAPAGETIYPENIVMERDYRGIGESGKDAIDNIVSLLRSAGLPEEMPTWFVDDGPEEDPNRKKAAVIGGGIAGIAAAIALAKKGIRPTIFEKTSRLGGSCRWLATNRRYDRDLMDKEMQKIEASGIRVIYNVSGGVRPDLMEMLKEYDAVLLTIGETAGKKPNIPGASLRGVTDIVSLMNWLNNGEVPRELGSRVVVAGGDDFSVDAARALKRLCPEVTLLTPCGKGKLQIKTASADLLLEEGINLVTGVEITEINAKEGRADSVSCRVLQNGSSMGVPCDTVVFGEGRGPDMETISLRNLYLDLDDQGYVKINSRLATNMRGVFALGDFNMSSIDAGKAGATAVENYLLGTDQPIVVEKFRPEEMAIEHERIPGKSGILPQSLPARGLEEESRRCITCGYHQAEEKLCIGCGICQKYCPTGAVWMEGVGEEA
ncbi:MAG: FAD-dependent oxidoreductase [Firmicutes bacterium]|nr:FAD-dependent oxidoreductase [Bacillota bacterium]